MKKLKWTPGASQDLLLIASYLSSKNPYAADKIIDRIEKSLKQLEQFPESGRPGRISRELVVPRTSYIVAYKITNTHTELLAILHGARLWPEQF